MVVESGLGVVWGSQVDALASGRWLRSCRSIPVHHCTSLYRQPMLLSFTAFKPRLPTPMTNIVVSQFQNFSSR